jgi:hypothetical protein
MTKSTGATRSIVIEKEHPPEKIWRALKAH